MRMARLRGWGVSSLALVVWATGCQNPDQLRIQALQEELRGVRDENDRLRSDLAKAISERDMWRNRAQALQAQLDEMGKQPTGVPGWQEHGAFAWKDVGADVLFDSGKADLKASGHAALQQVVSEINANFPDRMVWVIGHTDAEAIKVSKWKDNLDLSVNRGTTVYRELMKLGLQPQRMTAAGQGEYNPKAPNDARGRSRDNRRVQFLVSPMPGIPMASERTGTGAGTTEVEPPPK